MLSGDEASCAFFLRRRVAADGARALARWVGESAAQRVIGAGLGALAGGAARWVDDVVARYGGTARALTVSLEASPDDTLALRWESLDDALTRSLLGVVSETWRDGFHALRNPVAALVNSVSLVRRGNLSQDDTAVVHQVMQNAVDRVDRLVSDLQEMVSAGDGPRQSLDVEEALVDCAGRELVRVESNAVTLVWGDPTALSDALVAFTEWCKKANLFEIRLCGDDGDGAMRVRWQMHDARSESELEGVFRTRAAGRGCAAMEMARARWVVVAHGGSVKVSPHELVLTL